MTITCLLAEAKEKKAPQKGYSQTDIRTRLEALPTHTPWVIYMVVILQAITIAVLCAASGVIPPRLSPQRIVVGQSLLFIVMWCPA